MDDLEQIDNNPYVGPRAFETGEALYGRDIEITELLDLLIAERIILMYSPSGAGKTSLIQAALIPELKNEDFQVLPVMRVSLEIPEKVDEEAIKNPYVFSLLLSLEEGLDKDDKPPPSSLAKMTLPDYLARLSKVKSYSKSIVLIFDQFEEIFTLNPIDGNKKKEFFVQIGETLRDLNRWAIFALREEYVASLDPFRRHIPTRLSNSFRLELLKEKTARQSIQKPSQDRCINFTDAAAKKMVDDLRRVWVQQADGSKKAEIGDYVEPMPLQVICRQLWNKLPLDNHEITEKDIQDFGDADSALGSFYAEQVSYIAKKKSIKESFIREWFQHQLITEDRVRRDVLQGHEKSQGLENSVIWSLVDTHLVRSEKRRGFTWFELSHDRLIEPVRTNNAAWFESNLSTLQRQADNWDRAGKPNGLLLQSEALEKAERWADAQPEELEPREKEFLSVCKKARERAEREKRQARLIKRLFYGVSAAFLIAFIGAVLAYYFYDKIKQEKRLVISHELSTMALSNLNTDPELSILLALQALSLANSNDKKVTKQTEDAIRQAVQSSRVRLTLSGHKDKVLGVAFSPDGRHLATSSMDKTAKLWDAAKGRELLTLSGHNEGVSDVSFSPDGLRLATSSGDNTAKVWDATTSKELLTLNGHTAELNRVVYSPDGKRLATASNDNTAKVWDAVTGKELLTLSGHTAEVNRVAYSPDGKRLATASHDKTAKLWDAVTGKELLTLTGHNFEVSDVSFSPDGRRLATSSGDRTAKLWDATTGKELSTLSGHTNSVFSIAYNIKGTCLATACADGKIKVWDTATGKELLTLSGHTNPVFRLYFSPVGELLASASWDSTVKIWDTTTIHNNSVNHVVYSPDGKRLATASNDNTAKVWDAVTGKELLTLSGHTAEIAKVVYSHDGNRLATASNDKTVKVWDAATGKELLTLSGHTEEVSDVSFSPDGRCLGTTSYDKTAKVWDVISGKMLLTFSGHNRWVYQIAFSPDSTRAVTTSSDQTAKVWDVTSGKELMSLSGHMGQVYSVAFSPNGNRLATVSQDKTVKVWDAATGKELLTFLGHTNLVTTIAFSPNGQRLATGSWDKTAKIWDSRSGKELISLTHTDEVYSATFSPDGAYLATTCSNNKMYVHILNKEHVIALAKSRLTRKLTDEECQKYLHRDSCP